jgi:phosphopantothenoylcysteine decarboxylase/phosphopantothenate--cysteine ligase
MKLYPEMDIVVKAAAVADYRPIEAAAQKIKKGSGEMLLRLTPNEDILALLGREKKRQVLVGFAAETEKLLESARDKLIRKNLDLLVANDVSTGVFGSDSATAYLLTRDDDVVTLQDQSKLVIAGKLLDMAQSLRLARAQRTPSERRPDEA